MHAYYTRIHACILCIQAMHSLAASAISEIAISWMSRSRAKGVCTIVAASVYIREPMAAAAAGSGPLGGPLPPRLQFDILSFLKPADIQSVRTSGTDSRAATQGIFSMQLAFSCSFCMSLARLRCNACRSVFYCSRGHQCGHWLVHRVTCCVLQDKRKPIIFPGHRRG